MSAKKNTIMTCVGIISEIATIGYETYRFSSEFESPESETWFLVCSSSYMRWNKKWPYAGVAVKKVFRPEVGCDMLWGVEVILDHNRSEYHTHKEPEWIKSFAGHIMRSIRKFLGEV